MTLQDVIDRARILLQDENLTATRWTDDELIFWLNDAFREIVQLKPDANIVTSVVQLVEGIEQSIPASSIFLKGISRNMGTDGLTPGRAVHRVRREIFDVSFPGWPDSTAAAEVKYFIYDDMNPRKFMVYPPQPGAGQGYVEIKTVDNIATIDDPGTALPVDDSYLNAILDYVLHRAYLKDAEIDSNAQLASAYYQSFQQKLGLKTNGQLAGST